MLWNKLMNRHKPTLHSPMEGDVIPLEQVADSVFSEKMMGDGIAITPTDGAVVSPADGEIVQIAPTKHAIGIRTEDGAEILIHVGLDTVELEGRPFDLQVDVGDHVKTGQLLLTADLAQIHQAGKDTVTPMVVTNGGALAHHYAFTFTKEAVPGKTVVARVEA
ncbi:MAG: PTS glucose transporter subunit IIA [Exiguobacterium marinum]|uniref:PTS sugar transporter subunit IIA n=1 Tax=Exiguobacterium TaxID=33986 RepID=UPI001BE7B7B7|nr:MULTISPECIES: PTS glucose transporter subunit IIA [unclassified Exiguobacterium]